MKKENINRSNLGVRTLILSRCISVGLYQKKVNKKRVAQHVHAFAEL